MADYPCAVAQLLAAGATNAFTPEDWTDYQELGLGPEHIPDLIRMATDVDLHHADPDSAESWAPVHAWRALGQLRAEAAVAPLLGLLDRAEDDENLDEWSVEEFPVVFGMIGPPAVPALAEYLEDPAHDVYSRDTAASCLVGIGQAFPGTRPECVAHITRALAGFADNDPSFNALMIVRLVKLEAQESLPVIERAFESERVDLSIVGWRYVRWEFGLGDGYQDDLLTEREKANPGWEQSLSEPWEPPDRERTEARARAAALARAKAKAKAKRKQANKSRRKNRKR